MLFVCYVFVVVVGRFGLVMGWCCRFGLANLLSGCHLLVIVGETIYNRPWGLIENYEHRVGHVWPLDNFGADSGLGTRILAQVTIVVWYVCVWNLCTAPWG